jgi:ABC-type Fe3+/spermidine/putrescine transport system ATPase subunit
MTVAENIGYGLRMRGLDRHEIRQRADEALELVRLRGFDARFPGQLSGGQRQRVALARALVVKPDMLLLDEPLGALDRKLRDHMQIELKRIQRELGVTSIIVTHDQEEAMSLADRVAVMFDGQIREIGRPSQLYERPASRGVMDFLGDANFLDAEIDGFAGGAPVARTECGIRLTLPSGPVRDKARVRIGIRPENVVVAPADGAPDNRVEARVTEVIYKGAHLEIYATTSGGRALTARQPVGGIVPKSLTRDAPVVLGLTSRHLVVFEAEEEIRPS